jgi:DNA-binding transcriptional ArsR family regulator
MTQMSKQSRAGGVPTREASCCDSACCPALGELLEPRLFKALGDPTRQALLAGLSRCCRPCSVSEIATCCDIDFSVVSRHLTLLEQAGVLTSQKSGRTVHYELRFHELASRLRTLADALDACEQQRTSANAPCTGVCCCASTEE